MFRASRVLRMAVTKTTTGIVGLPVNVNARQDLIATYKDAVERITKYRLSVAEKHAEESAIEKEINCGQLEELIEQAEDELSVIPVYLGASPLELEFLPLAAL
jgi:NADH dehydrogenase (ubiquinone) 1 alpha subcomplex subunit 5